MKARYLMRVIQGNNSRHQVPVEVIAANYRDAVEKALALTDVHSPRIRVDHIKEVSTEEQP